MAREPFPSDIMLLARAIKLGAMSAWPPCLRLCGLLPESVVAQSGLSQGPGWKKRCRDPHRVSRRWEPGPGETWEEASHQRAELGLAGQQWADADTNPLEQFISKPHGMLLAVLRTRMKKEEEAGVLFPVEKRCIQHDCYPWHQLQLPRPRQRPTEVPELGVLPRGWRWGHDFLPAILHLLRELHWLPTDDDAAVGHGQVPFMELTLDFESHAGRPLPPNPQPRFTGSEPSLQENGRVLRLAVTRGRTRVYPAGSDYHQMSRVSPAGSRNGGGSEGPPALHHTSRGVAPPAKAAPIQFGASNSCGWRGDSTNSDARSRGSRQRHPATARVSERDARGKGEPRRRPGHMPVISTRAPSSRRGPAKARNTK